jgi:hypothetical protein
MASVRSVERIASRVHALSANFGKPLADAEIHAAVPLSFSCRLYG